MRMRMRMPPTSSTRTMKSSTRTTIIALVSDGPRKAANAMAIHIDGMFDEREPISQHPAVVKLTTSATLTNVKLAAALSDDDADELGMTIAYLKRALKAATSALDAVSQCQAEGLFDSEGKQDLRARIFLVRDGIISLMGDYRAEWRQRYGQG